MGFIWFQVFSYRYHIFIIGQIKKQIDQVDQVASKQASKQVSKRASKQTGKQATKQAFLEVIIITLEMIIITLVIH